MKTSTFVLLLLFLSFPMKSFADCDSLINADGGPPTDQSKTNIRKGPGEFGAARDWSGVGKTHTGVDIVMNQSSEDPAAYEVRSVADGKIAYVRDNGAYGNVVIVDHGDGCYSLYAHLANKPFTPISAGGDAFVKMGQTIAKGDRLGYMRNLVGDTDASGNAAKLGDPTARTQTHFSLFTAPPGRSSSAAIIGPILQSKDNYVDPTPLLTRLGYTSQ